MTFTGSNINMTGGADPNLVYTRIATSNGGLGTGDAGWNDSGALIRKGSNRALKKNVRPLSKKEAMAALRMEAVTFQWKKSQDLGDRRTAGFIAEQADEAGADLWLLRDGQGAPSGVRYAELTAAHNVLIQDLLDRVALLETAKG